MSKKGLTTDSGLSNVEQPNPRSKHAHVNVHHDRTTSLSKPTMAGHMGHVDRYLSGTTQLSSSSGPLQSGGLVPVTPSGHYSLASDNGKAGKEPVSKDTRVTKLGPATPEPPSPVKPLVLPSVVKKKSTLHSRSPSLGLLRHKEATGTNSGSSFSVGASSSVGLTTSNQSAAGSAYKTFGGTCPRSQTTSLVRKPPTPPIVRRLRRNAWMTTCKFEYHSSDEESEDEKQPEGYAAGKGVCEPSSASEAPQRPGVRLPISRLKQKTWGSSLAHRGTSVTEKPEAKKPVHKFGPSKRQEVLSASGRCALPFKRQEVESRYDPSVRCKENLTKLTKDPTPKKERNSVIQVNGSTYHMLKLIGKGGSSKVYMVLDEHKEFRAVKLVSLEGVEPEATRAFLNEVKILKTLSDCSRVVTLYDFEFDQDKNLLMLVMEAGDNDLASVVRSAMEGGSLNLVMIKFYWSEMLQAVLEIHNKGVIHSDLKPANFLFVKGKLKLIDFGIADIMQADTTSVMKVSQMGTVNFMPPESLTRTSASGTGDYRLKISRRSDIWSLGCILYILAYGHAPFQHMVAREDRPRAIIDPRFAIQFPPLADPNLLDVLKQCLRRNAKERPTISELLQHPFLTEDGGLLKPQRDEELQTVFSEIENMSPNSVKKVKEMVKLMKLGRK